MSDRWYRSSAAIGAGLTSSAGDERRDQGRRCTPPRTFLDSPLPPHHRPSRAARVEDARACERTREPLRGYLTRPPSANDRTRMLGPPPATARRREEVIEPLPRYLLNDLAARREFLRVVWRHTESLVRRGSYVNRYGELVRLDVTQEDADAVRRYTPPSLPPPPPSLMSHAAASPSSSVPSSSQRLRIRVVNADCIDVVVDLVRRGGRRRPLLMDAASRDHFGGGYANGARAQEEELCRRSTLAFVMDPAMGLQRNRRLYPLEATDGLYAPHVTFFRHGASAAYRVLDAPVRCAVGAVAAHNRPAMSSSGERMVAYAAADTRAMIGSFFRMAVENHHDAAVCVALGCGAFCNPAWHVAEIFAEVMQAQLCSGGSGALREVVFAILEDHNSAHANNPDGNFRPFVEMMRASFPHVEVECGRASLDAEAGDDKLGVQQQQQQVHAAVERGDAVFWTPPPTRGMSSGPTAGRGTSRGDYRRLAEHQQLSNQPSRRASSVARAAATCSVSGRPLCPYGAACYRQNPDHLERYAHPASVR